jgi:5-methylcytosine-specific restriction protein B
MARTIPSISAEPILVAARRWFERCWLTDHSLFSDQAIWTSENLAVLKQRFIDNPDETDRGFYEKLQEQLEPARPAVKQLAAEMLWMLLLFQSNINAQTKRDSVIRVWEWSGARLPPETPELSDSTLVGVGSAGVAFNTQRWRELNYFILASQAFKQLSAERRLALLDGPWEFSRWLSTVESQGNRQLRHMLRFFAFPDQFERISVAKDKRKILTAFDALSGQDAETLDDTAVDRALLELRQRLTTETGRSDLDFYRAPLLARWRKSDGHWLLAWNPNRFDWMELPSLIEQTARGERPLVRWTCRSSKARVGDIAWIVRLGIKPAVIMARGKVVSEPREEPHWDPERAQDGETRQFVEVELEEVRDPDGPVAVPVDALHTVDGDPQRWTPQQSGISIKPSAAELLSSVWEDWESSTKSTLAESHGAKSHRHEARETSDELPASHDGQSTARFAVREGGRVWVIAAGRDAEHWDRWRERGEISIGYELPDLRGFRSKGDVLAALRGASDDESEPTNHALAAWQFAHEIRIGDRVYAKQGTKRILGSGTVQGDYEYRPDEGPPDHVRRVAWAQTHPAAMPADQKFALKTLTEVTSYPDFIATIEKAIESSGETGQHSHQDTARNDPYSLQTLSDETGYPTETLAAWIRQLRRKHHVILQGPPGTGKTFVAKRMAKHLVANTRGRIALVQFHPSYAYEDFVQGIRPRQRAVGLQFDLVRGPFLLLCDDAKKLNVDEPCVLIIDEINRAKVSQVFGELMYALEYRDEAVQLSSGDMLKIPQNLHVIGTMNTADRSIAMVDHALRRRFSFIDLPPAYEVLQKHLASQGLPPNGLVSALRHVNNVIADPNYAIGISFFMQHSEVLRNELKEIWQGEIEPYLAEYFFDAPEKLEPLKWEAVRNEHLATWPE